MNVKLPRQKEWSGRYAVRKIRDAVRAFEINVERAELRRNSIQPDERSKDQELSWCYLRADRAVKTLMKMRVLE